MVTNHNAVIPELLSRTGNKTTLNVLSVLFGAVLLSALAQVALPLPWTPVPVTGQTFGVTVIALLWGRKRGFLAVVTYLLAASLGAPVLAGAKSGLLLGPTSGYLLGMLLSSVLVGYLADLGRTKTFRGALMAAFTGSVVTFFFGILGLAFFLPRESLLMAGLLPFLPGDLIKNIFAASLVPQIQKRI